MEKKISVSEIPGSLNLKFTFQFDHSSIFKRFRKKLFNSVAMFHNIRQYMFFVISEAFFPSHLYILFDTISKFQNS